MKNWLTPKESLFLINWQQRVEHALSQSHNKIQEASISRLLDMRLLPSCLLVKWWTEEGKTTNMWHHSRRETFVMHTRKLRICPRVNTLFIQSFKEETLLSRPPSAATVKNRFKSCLSLKSIVNNFFTVSSLTTPAKIRRTSNASLDRWMCGFAWTSSSIVDLDTQ